MNAPSFLRKFFAFDATLAGSGHPPLSAFWRRTIERFMRGGKRSLIVRAGRRSGKSLTCCKLSIAFALLGTWTIPPGELAAVAIVSVSIAEAQNKLRLIRAMLVALNVPIARETTTEIELQNLPIVFKCMAANMRTVVGISAIFLLIDEAARMRDEVTGANAARDVVATLRPTQATFKEAVMVIVSAPLGKSDYHAECFDKGETAEQSVAHCPTWEGNPTISEADTHALEPDPRLWAREYAAIPQAGLLSAFDEPDVERAFKPRADIARHFTRYCAIDASSGKADVFGRAHFGWDETEDGTRVLSFDFVAGFTAAEVRDFGIVAIVARTSNDARVAAIGTVFADQRESMTLAAEFRRNGVRFVELPWTTASKPRAVARLRRLLLEGRVQLPHHPELRRELLTFEEKIDPGTGQITFAGHTGDHLACLITACLADEEKRLTGSPITLRDGPALDRGAVGKRNESVVGTWPASELQVIGRDVVVGPRPAYVFGNRSRTGGGF